MALIASICLAHLGIRLFGINSLSFDTDESFTWMFSQGLWPAITSVMLDVHPPGYFLFMSIWKDLFGTSEISFRFPSVVFSFLTLLALLVWSTIIDSKHWTKFVLILAILFCFSAYEIHFARYARSYTLLFFLSTCFSYAYFRASVLGDQRFLVPSVACGVLALYTHHVALIHIGAAMAASLFCNSEKVHTYFTAKFGLAVAALLLPWVLFLPFQVVFAIALGQGDHFRRIGRLGDFLGLLSPASSGWMRPLSQMPWDNVMGLAISVLGVAIILSQAKHQWQNSVTRFLLVQIAFTIALMLVSPVPVFNEKTIAILLPALLLLLSDALARAQGSWASKLVPAFVMVYVAVGVVAFPHTRQSVDWRGAFRCLAPIQASAEHPVLLFVGRSYELITFQYYCARGIIEPPRAIWSDSKYGAVLVSPQRYGQNFKFMTDPGFRLDDGKVIRSSRAFWWMISLIFREEEHVSDIFLLRRGSGDLLEGVNKSLRLPITELGRFRLVALHHVPRRSAVWCTLFDSEYYVNQIPSVAETNQPPLTHFLAREEHREKPHPLFDPVYYLRNNPDVAASGVNPLVHFVERGACEGRKPHPMFDPGNPGQTTTSEVGANDALGRNRYADVIQLLRERCPDKNVLH